MNTESKKTSISKLQYHQYAFTSIFIIVLIRTCIHQTFFHNLTPSMKLIKNTLFVAIALSAGLSSFAHASKELAQKNACLACHAAEKKMVGPAYQDIAKKYAGQKDADVALAKSIKAGGQGKWGAIPMPAQTALSDADAKTLAKWILAGAK